MDLQELADAARVVIELWDTNYHKQGDGGSADAEVDERTHEAMLACMSALKRPDFGRDLAEAIAQLDYALT